MIVYYFGADYPLKDQSDLNIQRRNMAILHSIAQNVIVSKVYNITRTTRSTLFNSRERHPTTHPKIDNVLIAPILPERGVLKFLRPLNSFVLKLLNQSVFQNFHGEKQIAWCYWPKGHEDFQLLNLSMDMIFDTDHNIINDPNLLPDQKAKREQQLIDAGTSATQILSSSRSMLHWYEDKGFKNMQLILNGVFKDRINLEPLEKSDHVYRVTYCGTLSKWMKLDWLLQIISEKTDWKFSFIGDNYKSDVSSKLQDFPNVELLGFLEPTQADKIIKASHVCFGLYQKEEALDVNSMKLYDYLAQGVPVVVNNYHPNLQADFGDCLNIATSYKEFKSYLEFPKSVSTEQLERFLMNSTWNQRVQPILDQLNT